MTEIAAALPHAVPALGPDWMDPQWLLQQYGQAFFWLAIGIVFVECGLFFPILPGDSLLFAIGIFVAGGEIDVNFGVAVVALIASAFLGNVVGYELGRLLGAPLYERDGRIIKKKYFDQTNAFFDKHGAKALVIGRFVPIVRTYITVVAGVSRMQRRHFFVWSGVGAVLWVTLLTVAGYFLGNVAVIKDNLEAAILLIVALSVLPMVVEYLRHRRGARTPAGTIIAETDEVIDDARDGRI